MKNMPVKAMIQLRKCRRWYERGESSQEKENIEFISDASGEQKLLSIPIRMLIVFSDRNE
jgi:hypothetical protein